MYDETVYEEYMRNVLGYMPTYRTESVYAPNDYYIMQTRNDFVVEENSKCEELYPDIYRKLYPLVCNECQNTNTQITKEILEKMTENVYKAIEIDLKIETKNVRRRRQTNIRKK